MHTAAVPVASIKGRGAATAFPHRFSRDVRDAFHDGWEPHAGTEAEAPPATQVVFEDCKSAISENDSPDIYFDQAINPYRGCEHGCIYCYARPTHSYLNWSPGLDFETRLLAKGNVAAVLRRELARSSYVPRTLVIGSATDCYQPIERELGLTRQIIGVLREARHPFGLVTKGAGVERDLDLIAPMAADGLATVHVTLTTLDADLARRLEPRAAAPHRRLRVLHTLADAGVPVGVSLAPQIPFLNDDLEQVLEAAWAAGARSACYHVIRLPWEVAPLFKDWLARHYPDRAARVMARIHDLRGGKDYDADFATRMKGQGIWGQLIAQRFARATARIGFNRERVVLRSDLFVRPSLDGQMQLI